MEYSTIFLLPLWVSHLATFRGYEAALFHAYWVISSCGLFCGKCFLRRFDHRCINVFFFFYLCLSLKLFLLGLNNLSFFGFQRNGWTGITTCVQFFLSWISWFPNLFRLYNCRLDCRIRGSASVAIERRWKISRHIYKQILALKELSQSIFLFRRRL